MRRTRPNFMLGISPDASSWNIRERETPIAAAASSGDSASLGTLDPGRSSLVASATDDVTRASLGRPGRVL
jgi:hypothetical protein